MSRQYPRPLSPRKKLVFAAVALALMLCFLEGGARIVQRVRDPAARHRTATRKPLTLQPDPVLHHRWIPSRATLDPSRGVPYTLTINAQGFVEESDTIPEKLPGVFRVFMVGDSNTQSVVATPHKWARIVEQQLNDHARPDGTRYEVINAGCSSYSPLLYYLLLKTRILDYQPDLVVINVDMTDVVNDYLYRMTMKTDATGNIEAVEPTGEEIIMTPQGMARPGPVQKSARWLVENSVFLQYTRNALKRVVGEPAHRPTEARSVDRAADWLALTWADATAEHVDFSMKTLLAACDLLRARGIHVMVAGVPHHPQYTGRWSDRPHQILEQTCRAHGVPFLNLYERLKPTIAGSAQDEYYWDTDPTHFNVAGNRLWADALMDFLWREHPELLSR